MRPSQADPDRAFVLVIDMQEKLLPTVRNQDRVIAAARKLLRAVRPFHLPVLATEQYPLGLGKTDRLIGRPLEEIEAPVIPKMTFSAWAEPTVREAIIGIDRPQVIIVGVETHVCVQQTVLDMLSRDYGVFVCADAVGSRGRNDYERSLERMRQEGAWVTTTESVLFELCGRCDAAAFKAMLELVKQNPPPPGE